MAQQQPNRNASTNNNWERRSTRSSCIRVVVPNVVVPTRKTSYSDDGINLDLSMRPPSSRAPEPAVNPVIGTRPVPRLFPPVRVGTPQPDVTFLIHLSHSKRKREEDEGVKMVAGESVGSSNSVQLAAATPTPTNIPPLQICESIKDESQMSLREALERAGQDEVEEDDEQAGGVPRAFQDMQRSRMINDLIDKPVVSIRSDTPNAKGKSGFLWSCCPGQEPVIVCLCCCRFFLPKSFLTHGGCFSQPDPLKGIFTKPFRPNKQWQ